MKRSLTLVLPVLMLCSFTLTKPSAKHNANNSRIEVVFTSKTTFDQLALLRSDLHKKHIELTFNKLAFDANGLTKIDFSVDCGDGFKGAAEADHLTNNSKFGFFRDHTKGAATPFGTGGL